MRHFESWDGIEIAYHEWGERTALAPVVLHHGFVATAEANWVATGVVDALVAAGRHVIAPDARGHGHSEKPHDPARYGEQRMARDLAILLDTVEARQVDLVGYSMGAIVALILSSEDPRVRRLVVGGVGAGVIECGGVDRRVVSNESIMQALQVDDPASIESREAAAFRALADALNADRQALAAQARSVHRGGVSLERIAAPTLILAGVDDPMAVRPEVLAKAIPNAVLQTLAGNHIEALGDPRFAQSIVDFLARQRAHHYLPGGFCSASCTASDVPPPAPDPESEMCSPPERALVPDESPGERLVLDESPGEGLGLDEPSEEGLVPDESPEEWSGPDAPLEDWPGALGEEPRPDEPSPDPRRPPSPTS